MQYKQKIEKLVEELSIQDDTRILWSEIGAPADIALLEKAERLFAKGLKSELLQFYREMNGLQIIWEDNKSDKNIAAYDPLLFLRWNVKYKAVINFLPLQIIIDPAVWKDTVWFEDDVKTAVDFLGDQTSNDLIRKKLMPFDLFSVDMSMAVYAGKVQDHVLLLEDYHIDYSDSLITSFNDYLEFLILSGGLVSARFKVFNGINGHRQPILNFDKLKTRL